MGFFGSSEEKEVDTTGTVNNNMVVNTVDVSSDEITTLLSILVVIKVIELLLYIYKSWRNGLKRRFGNGAGNNPI